MDHPEHVSVMPNEVVSYLTDSLPNKPIIVDGTLGNGGHAERILEKIAPISGTLIGIDIDEISLKKTEHRLAEYKSNAFFVLDNFSNIKNILNNLHIDRVDGFLLDLGVSSMQLDNADRGFSFKKPGPLDMRMGPSIEKTAKDIVNTYPEEKLFEIIRKYGEERWARRIANRIARTREDTVIETTDDLEEIVFRAVPARFRHGRIHPATRTFQALRIETNSELESLETVLEILPEVLNEGAVAAIISFHSLEDRLVKNRFRELKNTREFRLINKKPITAQEEEISRNKRSRSAKLRVIQKLNSNGEDYEK